MKSNLQKLIVIAMLLMSITAASAVTNTVQIGNYFFNPTNLTINVGDVIRWTNTVATLTTHDSTRTSVPFPWASGDLTSANRTFQLTFGSSGTFPYFCNRHVNAPMAQNRHPEQTGTVTVVTANLPPSVSLTNPLPGASFPAPANIVLQADATDDSAVTNVQFLSAGTVIANDNTAPFSFTINNSAAGNYAFSAIAQDNGGLAATSATINVFVLTNAILSSPDRLSDGRFRFTVAGIAGQTYLAESSTNLTSWSAFFTNIAPANTFNITDSTSTNVLLRYYRTRQEY